MYAGAGMSSYYLQPARRARTWRAAAGELAVRMGNDKDFLATRVAYKLDLRGPS